MHTTIYPFPSSFLGKPVVVAVDVCTSDEDVRREKYTIWIYVYSTHTPMGVPSVSWVYLRDVIGAIEPFRHNGRESVTFLFSLTSLLGSTNPLILYLLSLTEFSNTRVEIPTETVSPVSTIEWATLCFLFQLRCPPRPLEPAMPVMSIFNVFTGNHEVHIRLRRDPPVCLGSSLSSYFSIAHLLSRSGVLRTRTWYTSVAKDPVTLWLLSTKRPV